MAIDLNVLIADLTAEGDAVTAALQQAVSERGDVISAVDGAAPIRSPRVER
jgi:hypothetical protein